METYTYIVALSIYTIAAIVWRFVLGIPFISGYGVGQRKTEGLVTLFMTKEELKEFRKQRKCEQKKHLRWWSRKDK